MADIPLYICTTAFKKTLFIYLFLERGKGGRKRGRETSMCGCLLCAPHWGPSLQPRHVPWLGIKPATLSFTGQCSIHWAIPARAVAHLFDPFVYSWALGLLPHLAIVNNMAVNIGVHMFFQIRVLYFFGYIPRSEILPKIGPNSLRKVRAGAQKICVWMRWGWQENEEKGDYILILLKEVNR